MADHRAPARGKPITYAQLEASYRACTEGTERVRVAFNEGKMYFRDPVTGQVHVTQMEEYIPTPPDDE